MISYTTAVCVNHTSGNKLYWRPILANFGLCLWIKKTTPKHRLGISIVLTMIIDRSVALTSTLLAVTPSYYREKQATRILRGGGVGEGGGGLGC